MLRFGVDEAGKGPVLGPMVAACVLADPARLPPDIDDSKKLSRERRESLARTLRSDDAVRISVAHVTPERIDDSSTDMNSLAVAAHVEALSELTRDEALSELAQGDLSGVVDACDTDPERFARRVAAGVDAAVEVRAEHGADETYPIVGAASVVAKVERDRAVDALCAEFGDVGSGYPSDPATRTFLREYVREHGVLPDCARTSWKTSRDALAAAEQSALDSF